MSGLFGTDGIRGRANRPPLTPPTLTLIGQAIGNALAETGARKKVLMGRDPRRSGAMVGGAILSGLLSSGVAVTTGGVLPTPAVARLTRSGRFGLGVVISASHNPAHDNGVKLFLRNGRKAGPDFEGRVEEILANGAEVPAGEETGAYRAWDGAAEVYAEELLTQFGDLDLAGLKIAIDCANGATAAAAPLVLSRLGATLVSRHDRPDGLNINRRCGATVPGVVARFATREGADVGISFDGDGDRAMFADETGRVIDGDAVMAVLARDMVARRRLPHRTVVATVMSNVGLETSLDEIGVRLLRTDVGDRNVVTEMDRGGFALGGEQSGHLLVRRGSRLIGDGIETALNLLAVVKRSGRPLSELAACFARSPQILVNVEVRSKPDLMQISPVADVIRSVEAELGSAGRVLVRYSGTEPLGRVMVEGPDRRRTREAAERIAHAIEREIGSQS